MPTLALFRLKPLNLLLWVVGPSAVAKVYYNCHIEERIEDLWKVHTNRVDRGKIFINQILGLGATYNSSGVYNDKMQDYNRQIPAGVNIRLEGITRGLKDKTFFSNPFIRFHEKLEKNAHFLDDVDDV
jgi:hypothetical protein